MFKHWLKPFRSARLTALTLLTLAGGSALIGSPTSAPNALIQSAQARAGRSRGGFGGGFGGGGFGSFGSRGSRSFNPGQGTTRMQPLPPTAGRAGQVGRGGAIGGPNRGSWLQRNPILGGIAAAIAGTVIGSMLMNALGGMGGFGSILMLVLGAAAIFALFSLFRRFGASKSVAAAGNGRQNPIGGPRQTGFNAPYSGSNSDAPTNRSAASRDAYLSASGAGSGADSNTQTRDQGLAAIALGDAAMTQERLTDALTGRFFQVQEAWSQGDRATLHRILTGEMLGELSTELSEMEGRGERNILKNIVIRRVEITEAWQEGDTEFVTARISARLLDYTEKNGRVVAGDAQNPTDFAEFWTFVRMRGRGEWILSAINQEA